MVEAGAQDFINKSDMNPEQIARIVRFSMYRKSAEENLRTAAQRDLLTGLPNRGLLEDRLEHAVSIALRKQTSVALMFLDLDKFKSVNDTYGHLVGDALLSAVGERLTECIRESDTVARIGGDEFMVLLEEVTSDDDAKIVAEKIISAINKPFLIGARKVTTSTSIGIDVYPGDACNTETLMKNADKAMYEAKSSGRNNYQLYSEHCNDASSPMQGELFR